MARIREPAAHGDVPSELYFAQSVESFETDDLGGPPQSHGARGATGIRKAAGIFPGQMSSGPLAANVDHHGPVTSTGWASGMKRAGRVAVFVAALIGIGLRAAEENFDFTTLRALAKTLAEKPHVTPKGDVPEWLRNLSYDELRRIEFGGGESLWFREKLPFQIQYLHPGFLYDKTVHLFELRGTHPR